MEKLENIVKVSRKGQIIIPKEVREALGIRSGGKLAVIVKDDEIILRKVEQLNISEVGSKVSAVVEKENINVDILIGEAIEWARKQK
jgi:AbrB family looped-hinge helix DNA binding protein